jgi:Ca2+-binding RTX toxin-like protein
VLRGGSFISTLTGGAGDDSVSGFAAENHLHPGAGDDLVTGSPSLDDEVDYGDASAGVQVDLERTGTQDTGGSGHDTLTGVEVVIGSAFADRLAGTEGSNALGGAGGDDVLIGRGGDDILVGGIAPADVSGQDVASYAEPSPGVTSGVTVSLATHDFQPTGSEGKDQLLGISGLIGSPFDDTLTGNAAANTIDAGAGSDTVNAGDGPDIVRLRDGIADHADCGGADDVVDSDVEGLDVLSGCEQVAFATAPVGPDQPTGSSLPVTGSADTTLAFRFSAPARQRLGRRGTVKASLSCPQEACTSHVSARLTVKRRSHRAGRANASLAAGQPRTLKLKLNARSVRRARAALRRGNKVSLRVTAVAQDAAGNRRAVTRTIALRR